MSGDNPFVVRAYQGLRSNINGVIGESAGNVYLYGVAGSILAHSVFNAWKEFKRRSDTSTEGGISAILLGVGKGFVKGVIFYGWIWPVHLVAIGVVGGTKALSKNENENEKNEK